MGPAAPAELRGLLGGLLLLGLLAGAGVLYAPDLARLALERPARGPGASLADRRPEDRGAAAIDPLLSELGLSPAGSVREGDEERVAWRMPEGTDLSALAGRLRERAAAEGQQTHLQERDELELRLLAWRGDGAPVERLLLPTLPALRGSPAANRRQRPLVALVVVGLGEGAPPDDLRTERTLSAAVVPGRPHSLVTARAAALGWHEVLVDLRGRAPGDGDPCDPLPYCSGLLVDPAPSPEPPPRAGRVLVRPGAPLSESPEALRVGGAWWARGRAVEELKARLLHLAFARGHSTLLIEAQDPSLPGLLQWAEKENAVRFVSASEIARPTETLGGADRPPEGADQPPSTRNR